MKGDQKQNTRIIIEDFAPKEDINLLGTPKKKSKSFKSSITGDPNDERMDEDEQPEE